MAELKVGEVIAAIAEKIDLKLEDVPRLRAAYESLDIKTMKDMARARIRVEKWKPGDKAPTGVLWESVHPHLLEGALAYSIYIDDALVYFQAYAPFTGATMRTEDELNVAIEKHVDSIVDDIVNAQIPPAILGALE